MRALESGRVEGFVCLYLAHGQSQRLHVQESGSGVDQRLVEHVVSLGLVALVVDSAAGQKDSAHRDQRRVQVLGRHNTVVATRVGMVRAQLFRKQPSMHYNVDHVPV
jgi:hypothetical protein